MSSEEYQGETGAERRRFPRKPMKLQVHCKCLDRNYVSESEANLAEDLGAGGLAMRSTKKMEPGQILMTTIFLPPLDEAEKESDDSVSEDECTTVGVLSRVAWSAPAANGGFLVGIQFLDLDRDDRKRLKAFLVNFRLDQMDSSLYD